MTIRMLVTTVLLLAAQVPAAAQEPAAQEPLPPRLALDEAIARAARASHRLGELRHRQAAAEAVVEQRRIADLPTLSLQAGYTRTNHVEEFGVPTPAGAFRVIYPDVPDNYRSRIDLQWPIYTGGRVQALERAARAEAEATGKDLAAARADLRLEVTRAFWAVVTARESVRVLDEALARVDAQLRDVRSRFDAGFIPPNDVASVEAQRARQQFLLLEARNQAAVTEADLARLVDAPPGSAIELEAALDTPAAAGERAALLAEARANRPERAAIEIRAAGAGERADAARAGRLPVVAIVGGLDYARPNPRIFPRREAWDESWDVGVGLTWSLWDNGRASAELREGRELALAARARLAEFDKSLGFEVTQRVLDLESARAQIAAAGEGVRAAAEARRVVQERFTSGVATSTELLDAQVALLQAELDRTRALAGARLAAARLERTLGR